MGANRPLSVSRGDDTAACLSMHASQRLRDELGTARVGSPRDPRGVARVSSGVLTLTLNACSQHLHVLSATHLVRRRRFRAALDRLADEVLQ
jgi:hypothetical protein